MKKAVMSQAFDAQLLVSVGGQNAEKTCCRAWKTSLAVSMSRASYWQQSPNTDTTSAVTVQPTS